jgi:mannosyltransferase
MTIRRPLANVETLVLLVLILAVGVCLRAWNLGAESLWLDEAHSINQAKRWWGTIWGSAAVAEPNPPLYFTFLQVWLRAFGDSEIAVRSLSVLFGMATIVAVFVLGRIAGGAALGLGAAAIAATSPLLVIYSRETRGYALVILAATVSIAGALTALSRFDRALKLRSLPARALPWLAYVAGAVVAVYSHNTLVLLPIILSVAAGLVWVAAPRLDWGFAAHWVIANAMILAIYAPWIPMVLGGDVAAGTFWVPPITFAGALQQVRYVYGQSYATALQPWLDIVMGALTIVGIFAFRRSRAALVVCLAVVVLVPLLTYLISLSRPIFLPRVLLWPLPVLTVLIAAGALALPNRVVAVVLTAAIAVGQAIGLGHPRATIKFEPWRDVVRRIAAERQPGDAILLAPAYVAMPYEYYAGPDRDVLSVALGEPPRRSSRWSYDVVGPDDLPERLAGRQRIWLITRVESVERGADALTAQLGTRFDLVDRQSHQSLALLLFVRRQ